MNNLMGIFDTHAHYDDAKFNKNRDELLSSMKANGVSYICNVGSDLKSSETSIELSNNYEFIYSAVGAHPECVDNLPSDWLNLIENLSEQNKVVAIGEIGLDYHYPNFSKKKQFDVFEKQLNLAQKLNKPVIIHSRDAVADTISILKNFPKVSGVIHCFSGSAEVACRYIEMGWYLGFTGVVTFKNAKKAVEAVGAIPIEKLVIETDCPYMAPEPWRGSCCNSKMLVSVANKIAEIKGMLPQEVVDITRNNAFKLYGIDVSK